MNKIIKIISMVIIATIVVFIGCVEPDSVSPSSQIGTPSSQVETPSSTQTSTPLPTQTSEPPEILSHSNYIEMGYFKVVGEVENTLSNNINFVQIVATFYDDQNKVIGTAFTFTNLDILKPNQKSPFELSSFPEEINPSSYKLQLSYRKTSEEPFDGLEILSHSSKIDDLGYYKIVGEVQNNGARESSFVMVVCTYYDDSNNVIGTSYTFTQLDTIYVGNSAPFELSSFPMKLSPSYYELQVQGR